MITHARLRSPPRLAPLALSVVLLALIAPAAWAQAAPATGGADATSQSSSGAIVVHKPRHRPPHSYGVPPDKAKAFAAEAARDAHWRAYRDSAPAPTPGACPSPPDPAQGANCATLQGLKDYPGLHTYVPQ